MKHSAIVPIVPIVPINMRRYRKDPCTDCGEELLEEVAHGSRMANEEDFGYEMRGEGIDTLSADDDIVRGRSIKEIMGDDTEVAVERSASFSQKARTKERGDGDDSRARSF